MACNNFEIVDLGVMVPLQDIINTAKKEEVDVIGLSGLITPSLDEMIEVAKEMERQDLDIPLMIGGATTSRAHTAVKIYPEYSNIVVHVNDASRSVPVAQTLAQPKARPEFKSKIKQEYEKLWEGYLNRTKAKELLSLADAQANAAKLDFENLVEPKVKGLQAPLEFDLAVLRNYIDWTPFFQTWQLHGKFPRILEDEVVGEEATKLFEDAQNMLDLIVAEKWIEAKGVFGIWEAQRLGQDDIQLYANGEEKAIFHTLRQQTGGQSAQFGFGRFCGPP